MDRDLPGRAHQVQVGENSLSPRKIHAHVNGGTITVNATPETSGNGRKYRNAEEGLGEVPAHVRQRLARTERMRAIHSLGR